MKPHGAIMEFTQARNEDLMKAYRKVMSASDILQWDMIAWRVVRSPAKRFYVSEERAFVVVSQLLKNRNAITKMRPPKRYMFEEIFKRFIAMHTEHPEKSVRDIIYEIVNSPAPEFYMAPTTAREIIFKIKAGYYDRATHKSNIGKE